MLDDLIYEPGHDDVREVVGREEMLRIEYLITEPIRYEEVIDG